MLGILDLPRPAELHTKAGRSVEAARRRSTKSTADPSGTTIHAEAPLTGFVTSVRETECPGRLPAGTGYEGGPRLSLAGNAVWSPAVNVYESDDAYLVLAELAGVGPDSVRIELDTDCSTLILRGRRGTTPGGIVDALDQEIPGGDFEREVALAGPVNPRRVRAVCRHGLLEVFLPKAGSFRPRRAPVHFRGRRQAIAC